MSKIQPHTKNGKTIAWRFHCPGCGHTHLIHVLREGDGDRGPVWTFNGDVERPSFMPSILASMEWDNLENITDDDWGPWVDNPSFPGTRMREVKPDAKHKIIAQREVCHSYVSKGSIMFLGDCTHALAGKTVELVEISEREAEPNP